MPKKSTIQSAKVNDHIVNWLKDYAVNANVKGFVVGISGGVDSAVTSTLCAQTGMTTLCVELPIHQAESQVTRAREHITQLQQRFANVSCVEVILSNVFETFRGALPEEAESAKPNLSLANARARLRMTTLYYFAGMHTLLVAGTGNKVEDFGVGFFTKYGDGGVDISPIANLLKSDVFALAKYLQIPASILSAAPTDGLFGDGRTDEDQLGASYDELEWAMDFAAQNSKTDLLSEREKEVLDIFKRQNKANQHKMNPIPVCTIPDNIK